MVIKFNKKDLQLIGEMSSDFIDSSVYNWLDYFILNEKASGSTKKEALDGFKTFCDDNEISKTKMNSGLKRIKASFEK